MFHLKIFVFTALKNCRILHRRIIVMEDHVMAYSDHRDRFVYLYITLMYDTYSKGIGCTKLTRKRNASSMVSLYQKITCV